MSAADISLEARILGICDVYDALISPRVYRAAWGREAALELLRCEAGVQFDARCVAALERVLARQQEPGAVRRSAPRRYAVASDAFLSAR